MTYSVIVTQKAKDDLRHYYAVAAKHAPETSPYLLPVSLLPEILRAVAAIGTREEALRSMA